MRIFAFPESRRTQRRGVRAVAVAVLALGAPTSAHAVPLATANVVHAPPRGIGAGRHVPGEPEFAPAHSPAAGATVAVRDSKFGKILVDGQGHTLYLFDSDRTTKSTCYHACATAWPPLTTRGRPQAGTGVSPDLLGTTARTDQTIQVTYNGHPLYYFITDKKPGDITGQGVNSFGALWWVLDPKGNKIETH